jgi:plasmid stabilization system protein ParE
MAQVRWTLQAADDLEAIVEFIATDSPHYASLLAWEVIRAVDRLALFPRSGRTLPELHNLTIRESILGNYRIVYRAKKDLVEILTIYHGARLLDASRFS